MNDLSITNQYIRRLFKVDIVVDYLRSLTIEQSHKWRKDNSRKTTRGLVAKRTIRHIDRFDDESISFVINNVRFKEIEKNRNQPAGIAQLVMAKSFRVGGDKQSRRRRRRFERLESNEAARWLQRANGPATPTETSGFDCLKT